MLCHRYYGLRVLFSERLNRFGLNVAQVRYDDWEACLAYYCCLRIPRFELLEMYNSAITSDAPEIA